MEILIFLVHTDRHIKVSKMVKKINNKKWDNITSPFMALKLEVTTCWGWL